MPFMASIICCVRGGRQHGKLPGDRVAAMSLEGWNVIDEERAILWREYSFSKGAYATTFAFRGADGLVVVSPGARMEDRAFDALAEFGAVRALVASNTLHHLGQAEWRKRFPDADSFCPRDAVAPLSKKEPGIVFRPLSELDLPEQVRWQEAPGFKSGETILSVDAKQGPVWFTSDVLTNLQRFPGPPLGWLFTLTGSAPGFRLFRLSTWIFVKNRPALREWMLARLDEHPPVIVVPGHGPAFEAADVAERARAELLKL
jgi:glyoxylase-like metal-dependent hydrolase (beta-lactamase superfamily II)